MAEILFRDAFVTLAAIDLSDHVRSVAINYKAESPETTPMGSTAKTRLGGLLDWSLDVEFNQDHATSKVDQTLFPLVGTLVAVVVRPIKGTIVSVTNPNYTGNAIMTEHDPVAGKVGDVGICKCKFVGSGALVRAIT